MHHDPESPTNHRPGGGGQLGLWGLVGLAFFSVCGGTYGSELAVKTVGIWWLLTAQAFLGVFYIYPYSMICLEQALMHPRNGGHMIWARSAFGPFAGFLAGMLNIAYECCVLGSYIAYSIDYLKQMWPDDADTTAVKVSLAVLISILGLIVCSLSMDNVGWFFVVTMVAVFGPFIATTVGGLTLVGGDISAAFGKLAAQPVNPMWLQGVGVIVWMNAGHGNFFVRVADARDFRKVPLATVINIGFCLFLNTAPLLVGCLVHPDYEDWNDGFFVQIARQIGGESLGIIMALGSIVSAVGMLSGDLTIVSEFIADMSEEGYVPKLLGQRNVNKQPVYAMLAAYIPAFILASCINFAYLAGFATFFYSLNVLFKFSSFLYFRHNDPTRPKIYTFPVENFALVCVVCVPALLLSLVGLVTIDNWIVAVVPIITVIKICMVYYFFREKFTRDYNETWQEEDRMLRRIVLETIEKSKIEHDTMGETTGLLDAEKKKLAELSIKEKSSPRTPHAVGGEGGVRAHTHHEGEEKLTNRQTVTRKGA